jgi:acyl-coenzyme A thioesterase PaaI-like protein
MPTESAFSPLKNFTSDNGCFACGKENPFGLHMRFFTDGHIVTSEVTIPVYMCGWGNLVHGGIITTLLDETMSWAAIHLLKRLILTRTMEIEFILPVAPNMPLRTEGHIERQLKNTEAEVSAVLYNKENQACARSVGRFALLSAKLMRRMKIMDDRTVDDFARRYESE